MNLINSFDSFPSVSGSPIDLPSLHIKMTPTSIDVTATVEDDAVGEWVDLENGYNATSSTNKPQLHIASGSVRQVDFVSANSDFLSIPHADVNFLPGTNAFTIVLKFGDANPDAASGMVFAKAAINLSSSGQYVWNIHNGYSEFYIGGAYIYYDATGFAANDVIAVVVRTTGMDVYQNNTKIINNASIGANTWSGDLILGATYLGATDNWNGNLEYFLMYDAELTPTELTNIYNQIN